MLSAAPSRPGLQILRRTRRIRGVVDDREAYQDTRLCIAREAVNVQAGFLMHDKKDMNGEQVQAPVPDLHPSIDKNSNRTKAGIQQERECYY